MDDTAGGLDRLLTLAEELGPAEKAPKGARRGDGAGRRQSVMPLIEIARTKTKDEAMAALDTWRERHPAAAERLQPADVLVDGMRGPSSIWYRIRINLQHVPDDQRPPQEELIADYSPWTQPQPNLTSTALGSRHGRAMESTGVPTRRRGSGTARVHRPRRLLVAQVAARLR